jgi:DNA-binding LacI/PurR family transcriptional regulator
MKTGSKNGGIITIKQIADMAGVSVATVSRVINHKMSVKEDTRRKILGIMEQRQINPAALLQTDQESRTILLCVPEFDNPFHNVVIEGIFLSANRNNYRVFITQYRETFFTFEDYEDVFKKHSFAGIILLSGIINADLLELLVISCPIVLCFEYSDVKGVSFVCIDDIAAARKATEHLISCGAKKIALLNGSSQFRYARQREQGYTEALNKAGLQKNDDWVAHISATNYDLAYSYAQNLLALPDRPDAFLTVSDVYALAVINAAKKAGLRVPEDISVVGFDNIKLSSMTDPSITTVDVPGNQVGCHALELLIEKINNPRALKKRIILDTQLIIRDSTAHSAFYRDVPTHLLKGSGSKI